MRKAPSAFIRLIAIAAVALCAAMSPAQVNGGGILGFGGNFYEESASSLAPIAQVAAKSEMFIALRKDGTLAAWGRNTNTGTTCIPMPRGIVDVVSVAAGYNHALGQRSNGTLFAWGENSSGQATIPSDLGAVTGFSGGQSHSIAIKQNGTVVVWGTNNFSVKAIPSSLTGAQVVQVAAGANHCVALTSDHQVVCWGNNASGQCTVPSTIGNVVAIDANGDDTVALQDDGTVLVWGAAGTGNVTSVPAGLKAKKIACGGVNFVIAQKTDGTMTSWGANSNGQLSIPTVTGLTQFSAGAVGTVYLQSDGQVKSSSNLQVPHLSKVVSAYGTGPVFLLRASSGTLAGFSSTSTLSTIPSAATNATGFSVAPISGGHALAINPDKTVLAWGGNGNGQTTVPAGLTDVIQVSAGGSHSLALKSDGTIVAWGNNASGQTTVPAGLGPAIQVAAGSNHSVALLADGSVVAWGSNSVNQSTVPSSLTSGVVQIAVCADDDIALKNDGTIVCWGNSGSLQNNVPTAAKGAVKVAAGSLHFLALKSDGTVVKWGGAQGGPSASLAGVNGVADIVAGSGPGSLCLPKISMEFSSSTAVFGTPITGTLVLPVAPGVGGADVTVFSSDVDGAVPGTVHVDAGSNTATFTLTPNFVTSSKVVYFSATYGGYTTYAAVTISPDPNLMSGFSLSQTEVVGGTSTAATGTVTLFGNATHNVTINLSSTAGATVPASVTVLSGQSSATFSVSHQAVATDTVVTVTASDSNSTKTATLTLHPTTISSISLNPTSVTGGATSTGTVTMSVVTSSARTVSLSSSNTGVATVPVSVTIPANSATGTFSISTIPSSTSNSVQITASYGGSSISAPLQVAGIKIATFQLSKTSVAGGGSVTGTVTLSTTAAVDTTVNLTSSVPSVAGVPATVTVLAGNSQATFSIWTIPVATNTAVKFCASAIGGPQVGANLTVTAPTLTTVTTTATSMYGIQRIQGTINISDTPPSGYTVALVSDSPSLSVPSTVTFGTGATSANFTIEAADPAIQTVAHVTVTTPGGSTKTLAITIRPNVVRSVTISPAQVVGGSSTAVVGKLTIAAAAVNDLIIPISTDDPEGPVGVPASVTVPAGQTTVSFPITHQPVQVFTPALVTADRLNLLTSAQIMLTPNSLVSLRISPSKTVGGSAAAVTGTITLSGATSASTVVTLISSNSAVQVPATVTVPAGSKTATFPITTSYVTTDRVVSVTAMAGGHSLAASLILTQNKVMGLRLSATSVAGGSTTVITGTVTLTSAVSQNTVVNLGSSDTSIASVPATCVVLAGQRTATFVVDHHEVLVVKTVTITASRPNTSFSAVLTVKPNPLTSHAISPATVVGGSATVVTGTVGLSYPVKNGTTVQLSISGGDGISIPATATIPAGQRTGTYTINHSAVTTNRSAAITATRGGIAKTATLRVTR